MSSMQFVLQPLPGTDEQFIDRLREVSDKVNKFGFGTHRIFEQLKIPVKEVVIGPNHIGVLLEDGKAFRVAFSINTERLDLSKNDSSKSGSSSTNTSNNSKASAPSSSRQLARSRARLMRTTGRSGSGGQGSGSRSTGVIIGGSSSSRPLVTVPATYVPEELISQAEVVLQGKSRSLIVRELQRTNLDVNLAVNNLLSRDDEDAEDTEEGGDNYVPEDLISLLDNGFHGDNNSVIIDPSDGLFTEEIFSNYSSIRNLLFDRIRSERNQSTSGTSENNPSRASGSGSSVLTGASSLSAQISSVSAEREAFSRWRDRQCYVPRRWLNKDDYVWDKEEDAKKKDPTSMSSPIWISEELQPWPDKNNTIRFKKIAAIYSEFIAVSENGELHQWRWTDMEPYKSEVENVYHPKTLALNLSEKIELISANFIRCTVVTESNRVATWMDEQLGYIGAKLEHAAISFSEFIMDPIVSVNVCSLYTAVRTENNNVYWWGVLPFDQRRYLWDKYRNKAKKPFKPVASDISVGTQVIMKKCPKYQTGSIGFTCANGVPKVGQLLNSVWDSNDVCRFKIINVTPASGNDKSQLPCASSAISNAVGLVIDKEITKPVTGQSSNSTKSSSSNKETTDRIDMPPPPSPASSTCSDTGSVTSHKRTKRMAAKDDSVDGKKDEELWQLKDVVFVEDKIGPIGKVLKVDGDFVAVRFPVTSVPPSVPIIAASTSASTSSSSTTAGAVPAEGKEDDWQQCRLLRREDVQVYKTAMTSRGPDWLQKLPKKINISHGSDPSAFQLLSLAVDLRGIHVVKKVGSKLHYSLYNLYNSKQEQNCQFSTDSGSFMGSSLSNISMICNNDCSGNTSTIILRDGYRALYPIAKDCVGSIKDPQWFDLSPVKAVAMTTISLASSLNSSNQKSKVCMTALLFESQKLMPHILRCDVKNAFAALNRLEKEDRSDVLAVLEERCDGARNIFHACTIMCSPTTNKDTDEKKTTTFAGITTSRSSPASTSVFATNVSAVIDNASAAPSGSNAAGSSTTSTFPSVSAAMASSGSSSTREGRTVSLREMMNRLINTDMEHSVSTGSNSASAAGNVEDNNVYMAPWTIESNTNSSSASINDVVMGNSAEEDISKIIAGCSSSNAMKLSSPNYVFDPIQRRENATLILQQMCSSPALRPYLYQLLSSKDAQGQTPFMLAVYSRAYEAGLIILNTILTLSEKDPSTKDAMIFPPGSPPDQSPLHVICYNDTCSFTWTGADHINQNIFECKTCGLTDSLCCCTECARVCHKGHDCKLKRTSPTAYCDCWEKCKCKALIAGNQNKRFALLCKLASCTDLVTKFNAKGESILLFLIQTVGRQAVEQRQYRANARVRNVGGSAGGSASGGASARKSSSSIDLDVNMPDHDLEPPKFARRALERLLIDWHAVRAMIMTGAEKCENTPQQPPNSVDGASAENYNIYLQNQNGSTLLDKFTHNLFVKCSADHLDTLLMTLVREMQNDSVPDRMEDAEIVARRFVRSVARVFVIFNLEKFPNPERRKSLSMPHHKHIQSCVKVFQTLHKLAIQELCEVSEALIAPVRLGVVRPTAPFISSSNMDNSDDLFSVEPLAPTSAVESVIEASVVHETTRDQATSFNFPTNYGIDSIALRDTSESEEVPNREGGAHNQEEDILESGRNEEGIQDDESDNEYTFNEPETESDSDDNQSNQDAQRSVQTGATVGSETDIGVLFLEDESGDSSPQEEEASEDGETDDHDDDEFTYGDQQLERRSANSNNRNDLAPQSMQWAIRSRDTARPSVRMPAGSSLVFIDPMALRRSAVPASTAVAAPPQEQHTMATTSSNLARAFGIIVRQISELLSSLSYNIMNDIETSLKIQPEEATELQEFVEKCLKPTWDWMFSVMDSTEAQLKFGAYLTNYTDPTHPLHPLNLTAQNNLIQSNANGGGSSGGTSVGINVMSSSSRRDFFTYCLSLMRAHTSEHRDALPVLDITALRHIAYVLDGFIYYMRNDTNFYEKNEGIPSCSLNTNENDDTDDELSNITSDDAYGEVGANGSSLNALGSGTSRRHVFFARSDSTLSLGCLAPDGFDLPLDVAIPLADKPHLLQPNSKRQDLFANLPLLVSPTESVTQCGVETPANILDYPPTKLGFSSYTTRRGGGAGGDDQEAVIDTSTEMINPMEEEEADDDDNDDSSEHQLAKTASSGFRVISDTSSSTDAAESGSGSGVIGNVYLQLKKKQYSDDPKALAENQDKLDDDDDDDQDRMDVDSAVVVVNDNVEKSASAEIGASTTTQTGVIATRPDVIIVPQKNQRGIDSDLLMQSSSNVGLSSSSVVRSVIVRAGGGSTLKIPDETSTLQKTNIPYLTNDETTKTIMAGRSARITAFMFPARGQHFCQKFDSNDASPSWNFLLGRWKLTLDLFGRVFMDDVGMEHGSVLPELRGFPVKEMRFRRHMEKLRNGQQRDLIFCKLERNRDSLIIQTFKELNTQFGSQNRRVHPPLTFNRVKVTFKDEPGEGSGVARSFYTSISEALLASSKMPNLESVQVGNNSGKYGVPFSSILRNRGASGRDPPTLQRRGTGSKILWRTARERKALNYDARPYIPVSNNSDISGDNPNDHLSMHLQQLGERLYPKIYSLNTANASKITGMLLEIPTPQLLSILSSEEMLRQKVNEALDIITYKQKSESSGSSSSGQSKKMNPVVLLEPCHVEDNEPLFYMPGKRGFYTPRQGYGSFERINAFRNIGRLIGLCLLQNELLPLFLQRHVLKYILGRKIKFHDLAFFDPIIYESFRQLIQNSQTDDGEEAIIRMELFFVIDLMKEEGGGSVELLPGGREIQVTSQNLFDYIRRYTEYRLVKAQEKALEAVRDGVFDVLPDNCMQSLTAEDLRLLLNGVGDINVSTLISYTTFNDESSEGSDKLLKFKRWFWSIVEKMNTLERQDLVYFWTGSPALPASEEGFQPLPSVTIRPADDTHLPTANTCISRLYIPLYSSKSILRSKLLLAIKSKNFGFV